MTNTQQITKQNSTQAWVVCMVAALYFFYIFIQMMKFNAIGRELMVDFKIGSTGLGTLSSIYFWGNVIFLFPAGLILDRCSVKKVLLLVAAATTVCTFLFSLTNNIASASWCFLFTGISGAFALMIPLRLASRWFPPEKMALASGLSVTIGFLGAMVSQGPLTWLVSIVGWRHAIQWDAALGVVLFALFLSFVKDYPAGAVREMSAEQATSLKFLWGSIKKTVINRQNWLFGLYTCLINLPIFVFGTFGASYLEQVRQMPLSQAAFANVLLFLGAMAGSPAFGWMSDKMKSRKMPMYFGGVVTVFLLLALMYAPLNQFAIYVLFIAIGFFTSAQVITYPVIAESNSSDNIATGFGMGSTLIMSGGAFLVPLFGFLMDMFWDGKIVNEVPWHTASNYVFALWMLPIAVIIGIIAIKFGKETGCKKLDME